MSKFEAGDKVRCIKKSNMGDLYGVVGEVYTVISYSENHIVVQELRDGSFGLYAERFELVEEVNDTMNASESARSANPAIEEYTKTVTVRKIRAQSVIKLPRPRDKLKNEIIVEAGYKGVLLKTRGHQSYECFADAEGLRTLAKQLTEIADVLQSQTVCVDTLEESKS